MQKLFQKRTQILCRRYLRRLRLEALRVQPADRVRKLLLQKPAGHPLQQAQRPVHRIARTRQIEA